MYKVNNYREKVLKINSEQGKAAADDSGKPQQTQQHGSALNKRTSPNAGTYVKL